MDKAVALVSMLTSAAVPEAKLASTPFMDAARQGLLVSNGASTHLDPPCACPDTARGVQKPNG